MCSNYSCKSTIIRQEQAPQHQPGGWKANTVTAVSDANELLSLQVMMGYSHSLVIARQDTEQEKERLKKLPEYNPRTI